MLLKTIKNFILNGKGLGFKIIIPVSFLFAFTYAIGVASTFKKEFNSPQIQEILTIFTEGNLDKIQEVKNNIIQTKINENQLISEVIKRALIIIYEKNSFKELTKDEITRLLVQSFYVQSIFLAVLLTGFSVFFFLLLYFSTTLLAPLFLKSSSPHQLGRILSFYWIGFIAIYTINVHYFLGLSFFFMALIVLFSTLLTAKRLSN